MCITLSILPFSIPSLQFHRFENLDWQLSKTVDVAMFLNSLRVKNFNFFFFKFSLVILVYILSRKNPLNPPLSNSKNVQKGGIETVMYGYNTFPVTNHKILKNLCFVLKKRSFFLIFVLPKCEFLKFSWIPTRNVFYTLEKVEKML